MATTATTLTGELEQSFLRRGDRRRRRRRYDGLGSDEATRRYRNDYKAVVRQARDN